MALMTLTPRPGLLVRISVTQGVQPVRENAALPCTACAQVAGSSLAIDSDCLFKGTQVLPVGPEVKGSSVGDFEPMTQVGDSQQCVVTLPFYRHSQRG